MDTYYLFGHCARRTVSGVMNEGARPRLVSAAAVPAGVTFPNERALISFLECRLSKLCILCAAVCVFVLPTSWVPCLLLRMLVPWLLVQGCRCCCREAASVRSGK